MLCREAPKNGDKLSALGYGCMRLPVRMQSINEKLAEKQIMSAMAGGVNYFEN
jgi:predicted aldo/keto reductase-like oxidoreductase